MIDPTQFVHDQIAALCPIDGVSLGSWTDTSTWTFHPTAAATPAQIAAAQAWINGYLTSVPVAIAAKLQALDAYATAYEQGGTTVSGQHWDTDDTTQAKITAAYNLTSTAQSPAQFSWQMSTGFVVFTKAQVLAAAPTIGAWVEAVFSNAHAHAVNIAALTTPAAVQAYDFTAGWPQGT